jgi:competence protein ComEA
MRGAWSAFLFAMACGFFFALAASALAPAFAHTEAETSFGGAGQSPLPDAPGKELTVKVCGQCHGGEIVASIRLTHEGWQETIANMVQLGAKATDAEQAIILDYVATHFAGEARRPLNVNSATPVELESVAGLLKKEAAALIAYREKNGPCKKLEDFKKVVGLDYKKIDARKDRLICLAP